MHKISVMLAEDHMIVREGLRRLLATDPALEVVGEVQDGRQAVAMASRLRPDVVLMDIAMPLLNGLEAARQMRKCVPATRIIMLSAHSEDAYVTSAIEAGAAGFLLKSSSVSEVCLAIREVAKGGTFFSSSVYRRGDGASWRRRDSARLRTRRGVHLTSRETEVLQLLAEGKANAEVAVELGIAHKTAEKHRGHLMAKLKIHDAAGLIRYAIAAGIIESRVQMTIL